MLENMQGRLSPANSDDKLTAADKEFIEQHFERVKRRPFIKTSCSECYLDAMREMLIYLRKNELMEKSNYILKNGVVLQMPSDPVVYTNSNLTDEVAERYLMDNPKRIGFFAVYPQNWEKRIKAAPDEKVVKENKPSAPKKVTAKKKAAPAEKVVGEVPANENTEIIAE